MQIAAVSTSACFCRSHIDERSHSSCHSSFPFTDIPSPTSLLQLVAFSMQATTFTVGLLPRSTLVRWWLTSIRASRMTHMSSIVKTVSNLFLRFSWDLDANFHIVHIEKSFHVFWERVLLQNKTDVGPFTFSAVSSSPQIELLRHSLNWIINVVLVTLRYWRYRVRILFPADRHHTNRRWWEIQANSIF